MIYATKHRHALVGRWFLVLGVLIPDALSLAGPVLMYAHDSHANLYTVDVAGGEASLIGNTGTVFLDIAFDATGNLFGVALDDSPSSQTALYAIDPESAVVSYIGSVGEVGVLNALVFDEQGTLWGAGYSDALIAIDPTTGAGVPFGSLGGYQSAGDLALDARVRMLLTTHQGQLIEIDRTSGVASAVGSIPWRNVFGLARGTDDVLYGITSDNRLLSVDPETGRGAILGELSASFPLGATYGTSIRGEAAPEPATLMLLLVGGWFVVRRARAC